MKKPVVKGVNLKNPLYESTKQWKKDESMMCIVVKHTSQNIPKEQEQHYPLFYISWASGGGALWDVPVIGHELLRNQPRGNGKWLVFAHGKWPMFSFFDRFSNTIFEYLWLLAHPRVPFSKPWRTKPYVCATMLNLSVYFKLWSTYQLSYLHLSTQVFTSDLLPLPDYSFGG